MDGKYLDDPRNDTEEEKQGGHHESTTQPCCGQQGMGVTDGISVIGKKKVNYLRTITRNF